MNAKETSRLYNLMKASQLHKQHTFLNKQGRFAVKSSGKKLKIRWRCNVSYNPSIHDYNSQA